MRRLLLLFPLLLLTACASGGQPVISFIGIATGTLTTDLQHLQFRDRFTVTDHQLVAVIGFRQVGEGTTVQATWFSPDDRRMPLGRTQIVTQSGATITRFSFASTRDWEAAPYMLQIDAFTGEGESMRSATGSLSFYIGLKEEDIAAYQKDFAEWKKAEASERAKWEAIENAKKAIVQKVTDQVPMENAVIAFQRDLTGDDREEYVIQESEAGPGMGGAPGVLFTGAVRQAAIADGSGAVLLSIAEKGRKRVIGSNGTVLADDLPKEGDIQFTVLPSFTISLSWTDDEQECFAEIEPSEKGYAMGKKGCR